MEGTSVFSSIHVAIRIPGMLIPHRQSCTRQRHAYTTLMPEIPSVYKNEMTFLNENTLSQRLEPPQYAP